MRERQNRKTIGGLDNSAVPLPGDLALRHAAGNGGPSATCLRARSLDYPTLQTDGVVGERSSIV